MNAIDRANRDLEQGDHWLARQRLASYLSSKGYDPDLLAQLGNISYDMHDAYAAGRMWLTSTAEGERVEEAIAKFIERAGHGPQQIASQLPRAVRLTSLDEYPPSAQARLRRLGLEKGIIWRPPPAQPPLSKWIRRAVTLGAVLILTFCVGSCILGLERMASWLFGVD